MHRSRLRSFAKVLKAKRNLFSRKIFISLTVGDKRIGLISRICEFDGI